MRIVIFGCGNIYKKYKDVIKNKCEIVYMIDNKLAGQIVDGLYVNNPRDKIKIKYDYIVIMSNFSIEMRKQLVEIGYSLSIILHYLDFLGRICFEQKRFIVNKDTNSIKRALIVSNNLGYHGGTIVAYRAAKCMRRLGYNVTIAVGEIENKTIVGEFNNEGVNVIVQENLSNSTHENIKWISDYDKIIINTFPMIKCASNLKKEYILWLHEALDVYPEFEYWDSEIKNILCNCKLRVFAVSEVAKVNFTKFYNVNTIEILPVAIEDWKNNNEIIIKNKEITFAVIGGFVKRKGQDIVLKAINCINNQKESRFIFIGKKNNSSYCEEVIKEINNNKLCKVLDEKSIGEMKKIYDEIDVVIVPSLEETFSMVAAEAMMMGKVCIVSNRCGIADYITNGKNGLIFNSEDVFQLGQIIDWCTNHEKECISIGKRARKLYENNFTMEILEKNIKKILA